jgi:flagellar biosynthetic protein FlhB
MSPQPTGEKTEKATPRRKREAREKGQIFKSVEVNTALSMLVMFGVLAVFGRTIVENIKKLLHYFFTMQAPDEFGVSAAVSMFGDALWMFMGIIAPVLVATFVAGAVFNLVQVGFIFSPKALSPKFDRINPLSGFKRVFSKKTLIDLVKAIIKIAILAVVAYNEFERHMAEFNGLMGQDVNMATASFVDMILSAGFNLAIAFAIFAPFDYMYQRWKYNKDLMMTKQEVKDEYKLTEGNPQIKGRIAQKQRQMSRMRMVQAVKDADVVITNPTHYAVALEYKEGKNTAPVIIAKGKDYLAQKIKEKAREESVTIVENKPLAQSLYFFCEVGDEVPEDMYKAVAEVLAYVYRMKKKGGQA